MCESRSFSALLEHHRAIELARCCGGAAIHRPHSQVDRRTPLVHGAATGRETITDDRIGRECAWSSTVTVGLPAPGTERQSRATATDDGAQQPPARHLPLPRCSLFETHGTPRPARSSLMPSTATSADRAQAPDLSGQLVRQRQRGGDPRAAARRALDPSRPPSAASRSVEPDQAASRRGRPRRRRRRGRRRAARRPRRPRASPALEALGTLDDVRQRLRDDE